MGTNVKEKTINKKGQQLAVRTGVFSTVPEGGNAKFTFSLMKQQDFDEDTGKGKILGYFVMVANSEETRMSSVNLIQLNAKFCKH